MKRAIFLTGLLVLSAGMLACSGSAACPTKDKVKTSVKDLIPGDFTVEEVNPLKDIKGLCEVVVKVGASPIVFYMDQKGEYVLAGNLLSLKDKKNLTRERQQEFMKISQDKVKELEKYTDMTFGAKGSGKFIYFFTDPDCPFCKRAEPIVEEWAKKNNVEVRVILYPLPIHPDAFPKSVSLVCDKKTWEDYKRGYMGSQCEEGKKKVQSNLELGQKLGINGTPTFIGMNGKVQSGLPTEDDLNKLIN